MDYEPLRIVAQDILDNKMKFDMDNWCTMAPTSSDKETREQAACCTTACIAGWIAIRGGKAKLEKGPGQHWHYQLKGYEDAHQDTAWQNAAMDVLGVDCGSREYEDLHELFRITNSEAPFVLRRLVDGEDVMDAINNGNTDYLLSVGCDGE